MSVVYFVREENTGMIKIGSSEKIRARFSAMQADNSSKLTLLCTIGGGVNEESWLHEVFSGCRTRGEWFSPNELMLEVIDCLIAGDKVKFRDLVGARNLNTYVREKSWIQYGKTLNGVALTK